MSSVYPAHINGHVCLFSQYLPIIFRRIVFQHLILQNCKVSALYISNFCYFIFDCDLFIMYDKTIQKFTTKFKIICFKLCLNKKYSRYATSSIRLNESTKGNFTYLHLIEHPRTSQSNISRYQSTEKQLYPLASVEKDAQTNFISCIK